MHYSSLYDDGKSRMDHGRGKRDGCGSGINFTEVVVVFREHPLSTYADFPAFLTPSPPLVRFSRNLSVLSYAYFPDF